MMKAIVFSLALPCVLTLAGGCGLDDPPKTQGLPPATYTFEMKLNHGLGGIRPAHEMNDCVVSNNSQLPTLFTENITVLTLTPDARVPTTGRFETSTMGCQSKLSVKIMPLQKVELLIRAKGTLVMPDGKSLSCLYTMTDEVNLMPKDTFESKKPFVGSCVPK